MPRRSSSSTTRFTSRAADPCSNVKERLLQDLDAVYRDADAAHAGWTCPASTECCRFGVTGREPYVTSIELTAVRRAVAALGSARALGPRPPPLDDRPERSPDGQKKSLPMLDERICPLLDASGRCAIYAWRPLGCRTYFCDRAFAAAPVRHKEIKALVRRIQDIAAEHEPEGDRGRPLTRALEPYLRGRRG